MNYIVHTSTRGHISLVPMQAIQKVLKSTFLNFYVWPGSKDRGTSLLIIWLFFYIIILIHSNLKIHIQNNEGWNGQNSHNSHTGRVPSTAAIFPHWIATAALCIKKWKERGLNLVCWPSSLKNVMASEPNTPDVSMAMGTKWWLVIREEYFCFFLRSASSATAPASLVASVMWDGANVSGHVASHTRTRPPFHGTIVAPSGCLPSDHEMPVGSRCAGIFTINWYTLTVYAHCLLSSCLYTSFWWWLKQFTWKYRKIGKFSQ